MGHTIGYYPFHPFLNKFINFSFKVLYLRLHYARRQGYAIKGANYASRLRSCNKTYTSYLCVTAFTKSVLNTSFYLTCPSVSKASGFQAKPESTIENFVSILAITPTSNFT